MKKKKHLPEGKCKFLSKTKGGLQAADQIHAALERGGDGRAYGSRLAYGHPVCPTDIIPLVATFVNS